MKSTRGDRRFWASTRGRIILLLRRGSRSVNELASSLKLTDNAVRTHLTALERDGLVQASGTRPGTRRPTVTYELTADADYLFPKMYAPILRHLLEVLAAGLPARRVDELVRAAGKRMAEEHAPAVRGENLKTRVAQTAAVLRDWGGMAEAEHHNGRSTIRCFDCPLAAVAAAGRPEVCRMLETLVAELTQASARQHCQSQPAPQCYFEIESPAAAPSAR
jgi:predicted ArsR family transcriptional regulator